MLANVYTMVRKEMWSHDRRGKQYGAQKTSEALNARRTLTLLLIHSRGRCCEPKTSHLRFALLQEGLQPLLGSPSLVVVAHYQDDVVPVKLAHQVKPNVRLVGIRGDGAQKGQVDALPRAKQEAEINLLTFGMSSVFMDTKQF